MNDEYALSSGKRWLARLSFILIGISSFANPLDFFNLYNIGTGLILGLLYGFIFQLFLRSFLSTFNWKYKKTGGSKALRYSVENGLIYLVPYALIMTLATFILGWGMSLGFVSTGIMTVGATATMELGKIKGKQEIKNTIATTVVAFLFSTLWTLGLPYMVKLPALIEGGITLVKSLIKGGSFL